MTPINVSVKNVPDDVMEKLRERAKRHHRSLQGELMAILEEASAPTKLTFEQLESQLKSLHFKTPDEATTWVREMRDAR